jgi:hypothetical protein
MIKWISKTVPRHETTFVKIIQSGTILIVQLHYLLPFAAFDWVDAVDAATIPLAFDLRATRHRETVQEVGQRVSGNPRRSSPDAPWLLHMWMRRQIIVISVIATNTADGRHLRRLLKLPPSKTF